MKLLARLIVLALFGLLAMPSYAHYDYGSQGQRFTCKSENYSQNYCPADTRFGVSLVRQISNSSCVQGRSWGYDRRGVWVSQGCEAEFVLGDRYGGWQAQTIRCKSSNYNRNYCVADTRGGVRLVRQISDSACVQGRSWGYDQDGIWVSSGCEAEFTVSGGDYGNQGDYGPGRIVRCESRDSRTNWCRIDTRGGVRLVRRLSNASCYQGRSWDWDRSGIWVSNGCRADFQVGGWRHDHDHGDWDDRH